MKRIKLFIILCLASGVASHCTDVVQVKLDEGSELIVIDAFLESQYDGQAIFIHKNSRYFNTEKPEPVLNARVVLYDLTNTSSYTFHYAREDRYEIFLEKEKFEVGHQYKLEVTINGETYSALTIQPRAAKIDSIAAAAFDRDQITGEVVPRYYMCTLWAKDRADDIPDYYWIKSSRDPSYMNLCIDGTAGVVKNASADSLYFTTPYTLFNFMQYYPGTFCDVAINAITRETHDFLVQAQAQINNGGLFATTPENVKTNFTTVPGNKKKVVGWFSVATISKANRTIPG